MATSACIVIHADILLTEHFFYPDGPLADVSSGVWQTHSGTAGQVIVSGGQVRLSQRKSEDVSALFPGGPVSSNEAAALYVTFNMVLTGLPVGSNGTYFAHFKDGTATTGMRCRIFATTNGAAAGQFRLGVAAAANAPSSALTADLNPGVAYRVVCRMRTADNESTLWINPQSEGDPGIFSTDETSPKAAAGFALRESLASGSGMGELGLDDLIIATSFDELTPDRPLPLKLSIWRDGSDSVQLRWNARPEQTYAVWAADSPESEFIMVATQLWFAEGPGYFTEMCRQSMRLYRVCAE